MREQERPTTSERPTGAAAAITRVTAIYALVAAVWIALSDALLFALVPAAADQAMLSTLKGALFVVVTAGLLHYLMRRWLLRSTRPVSAPDQPRHAFVLLCLAVLTLTSAGAYTLWREEDGRARARLAAMAELQGKAVGRWLDATRSDVDILRRRALLGRSGPPHDAAGFAALGAALTSDYVRHRCFSSVSLFDATGTLHWQSTPDMPHVVDARLSAAVHEAARHGRALELPPRQGADARYVLDFVVPLAVADGVAPVAMLRCDLAHSLATHFTLFGELERELRFALTLHQTDGVEVLSWGAGDTDMEMVAAAAGVAPDALEMRPFSAVAAATAVHGHDVRGTRVLAARHVVPGTDWWLTASEPLSVIAVHTTALVAWLVLSAILGIALGAVGLALQRQRRETRLLHALNVDRAEQIDALKVFEAIIENSPDAIFAKTTDGRYVLWNRGCEELLDVPRTEVLGQTDDAIFGADEAREIVTRDRDLMARPRVLRFEECRATPEGPRDLLTIKAPLRDADGHATGLFGIARDITELRHSGRLVERLNRALRARSACNRAMLDIQDETALLQTLCEVLVRDAGYALAWIGGAKHDPTQHIDVLAAAGPGRGYLDDLVLTWDDSPHGRGPGGTAIREQRAVVVADVENDATYAPWREAGQRHGFTALACLPVYFGTPAERGVLCVYGAEDWHFDDEEVALLEDLANDIVFGVRSLRERVQHARTATALVASEERYRLLFEAAGDAIAVIAADGRIVDCNRYALDLLGYTRGDLLRMQVVDLVAPTARTRMLAALRRVMSGVSLRRDWELLRRDGSTVTAEVTGRAIDSTTCLAIARDISARKRASEELQFVNWTLTALRRALAAITAAADEEQLLRDCCEAIISSARYTFAWVGWVRGDAPGHIEIVHGNGPGGPFSPTQGMTWSNGDSTVDTATYAVTSGAVALGFADRLGCSIAADAPEVAHAVIGVPITLDARPIGVMAVYATTPAPFAPPEVTLFEEFAEQMSRGLDVLRTREAHRLALLERQRDAERLSATLEDAISALMRTLELRDPYTAGHERRVAELAVAIGRVLGFDAEHLRWLHLAGVVHDVGKIQVPAEILSKPTRLSPTEYALVREHAQAGYDILRQIDFPWPLADVVRQHHEYLDGSGYPQGLASDEILLEARILTVADIVEAMSSHRPYRAALGIDAALETILGMRGQQLDSRVVDTCVTLFRAQGFRFEA